MTAGTSIRRSTLKTTESENNFVGVQPAVDQQVDYNVYTPDVQVDDKLGLQYGDHDGRSWNKTIMAKLVHHEENAKRRLERPTRPYSMSSADYED